MNCRRVRELLPLHVEGDLSPREARGVRLHLAECAPCRDEEAAFLESQAFWKEAPAPAFDETFHADVRRAVRVRIGEEEETRAQRWTFGAWSAAATATAVLVVVAVAAVGIAFLAVPRLEPASPLAGNATPVPLALPEPSPVAVAEVRPEIERERRAPIRRSPPRVQRAETAVSAVSRVTRIEMTTNDPSVRIIWLVKASDAAPI